MQQPSLAQARSFHAAQAAVAQAAVAQTAPMFVERASLVEIAATVAAYQVAAAQIASNVVASWSSAQPQTDPAALGGWSSLGFPIVEPIVATIDQRVPAPAEAVPAPWWTDSSLFEHAVEMLIYSEVADAGRTASQVELTSHGWRGYVRVLTPPSCSRCAILAGRVYRWSTGFQRHPRCDCVMVPTNDDRESNPLLTDPAAAIKAGQVRGLSKADTRAIVEDGADPGVVVNAYRGTSAPGITGATRNGERISVTLKNPDGSVSTYKATSEAATKRSRWRQANPNKDYRLRPEGIYRWVEDKFPHLPEERQREIALQQLRNNGYVLTAP